MQLSGLFQERIIEEHQEGIQEGRQQTQYENIETILTIRFGTIDQELQSIIGTIAELPSTESFALLMSLSKDELIARFRQS